LLKKSITYDTFNDETITEDFYFHLSEADLVEMEMSHAGGLKQHLEQIVASGDGAAIIFEFKTLIMKAYGKKSDDGKRFLKTEELRQDFLSSRAYSKLFMELATDANKAAEFVNAIVPVNLEQDLAKLQKPDGQQPQILTPAEVEAMDMDELKSGLATGKYKLQ
jgi:hypothetical protein